MRLAEEVPRFRPLKVRPEDLALPIPVFVGPPGTVLHDGHLFSQIHQEAYNGAVLTKNLTTKVNEILEANGERLHLSPRKVGAVLSTLGFRWKRRTSTGWKILLKRADQVRVHKLVNSHGMDLNTERFLRANLLDCPLCKGPRPELQSDPK